MVKGAVKGELVEKVTKIAMDAIENKKAIGISLWNGELISAIDTSLYETEEVALENEVVPKDKNERFKFLDSRTLGINGENLIFVLSLSAVEEALANQIGKTFPNDGTIFYCRASSSDKKVVANIVSFAIQTHLEHPCVGQRYFPIFEESVFKEECFFEVYDRDIAQKVGDFQNYDEMMAGVNVLNRLENKDETVSGGAENEER